MTIEVVEFKPCDRNTLKGFLTIRLTSIGLEIHDIAIHQTEAGSRWLNLPCKSYIKEDHTTGWRKIVDFYDKKAKRNFEKIVFETLDKSEARYGSK